MIDQSYCRIDKHRPKLGAVIERLVELLKEDEAKPVKHRRRAQILFEQLQREGYAGGYDAVRRYVGAWRKEQGKAPAKAFIPLEYDPGDAFQFDWSYEQVELGGMPAEVKRDCKKLCVNRFLRARKSDSAGHAPKWPARFRISQLFDHFHRRDLPGAVYN